MSDEWRRVIAALLNDETRTTYAEVVLTRRGDEVVTLPAAAKRRERSLARLEQAGMISRAESGDLVANLESLRVLLAEPTVRPDRTGSARFLGSDGRIDQYPANHEQRVELLKWVAECAFAPGVDLTEAEVNTALEPYALDVVSLRRYLVDARLLERDPEGRRYRLRSRV